MVKKKDELFLNGKFKKTYAIATIFVSIVFAIFCFVLSAINSSFIENEYLFSYTTCFYFVFIIGGLILDEKIRKYPGLVVVIGSACYSLSYMVFAVCKGGLSTLGIIYTIIYLLFMGLSFVIFKYLYPKIVVMRNGQKIFNTGYLMIIVSITFILGTLYWL